MLDTLEQLNLELLLLSLHDIDGSVSELVREREVVLRARQEQRLCNNWSDTPATVSGMKDVLVRLKK